MNDSNTILTNDTLRLTLDELRILHTILEQRVFDPFTIELDDTYLLYDKIRQYLSSQVDEVDRYHKDGTAINPHNECSCPQHYCDGNHQ